MRVRRLVASIGASFDEFVTKMENHEAVATCVINDVHKYAAQAHTEKRRVEQRCQKLLDEREHLDKEAVLWKHRAKSCMHENEYKALECLRQAKVLEKRRQQVQQQYEKAEELRGSLNANLREIEAKMEGLEARRAMLSSREAKAQVESKFNNNANNNESEAIFDRWEREIISNEYKQPTNFSSNDLETLDHSLSKEFETQEAEDELKHELDMLREEDNKGRGECHDDQ